MKPRATKSSGGGPVRRHGRGLMPAKIAGSGIVSHLVRGPLKQTTRAEFSPAKLIKALESGLSVGELTDLRATLDVPVERLAPMLGISKATFHRRKGAGHKLTPSVSDRVVRFARLLGKAVRVFDDIEDAKQWLNSPQFGLGGAAPLDYAKTEVGAREVENLLGRIEYGVYS